MSARSNLAKEIHMLEEEIRIIEIKRSRSMASIMTSLVTKEDLNETDVNFFRTYTAEIDVKREQLQALTAQLKKMM